MLARNKKYKSATAFASDRPQRQSEWAMIVGARSLDLEPDRSSSISKPTTHVRPNFWLIGCVLSSSC
jgi:hypothetical protein